MDPGHDSSDFEDEDEVSSKNYRTSKKKDMKSRSRRHSLPASDNGSFSSAQEEEVDRKKKHLKNNRKVKKQPVIEENKLNIRCNPKEMILCFSKMNQKQRAKVSRHGFQHLLLMESNAIGSRKLLVWLLDHTTTSDMVIRPGNGQDLPITKEIISLVLGVPCQGASLPSINLKEQNAEIKNLRAELKLKDNEKLNCLALLDRISKGGVDDLTMRCIFLFFLNRFLLPSSNWDIAGPEALYSAHWKTFNRIDWAQVIYDDLCSSVAKWHDRNRNQVTWTIYGCSLFFNVYYLDTLDHKSSHPDKLSLPRTRFYDSARITALAKSDQKVDRKGVTTYGNTKVAHPSGRRRRGGAMILHESLGTTSPRRKRSSPCVLSSSSCLAQGARAARRVRGRRAAARRRGSEAPAAQDELKN